MLLEGIKHSAWQRISIQQYFTGSIYLEIFIRNNFLVVLKHWNKLPRKVGKVLFCPLLITLPPSYIYGMATEAHDTWLSMRTEIGRGSKIQKQWITLLPLVFRDLHMLSLVPFQFYRVRTRKQGSLSLFYCCVNRGSAI